MTEGYKNERRGCGSKEKRRRALLYPFGKGQRVTCAAEPRSRATVGSERLVLRPQQSPWTGPMKSNEEHFTVLFKRE